MLVGTVAKQVMVIQITGYLKSTIVEVYYGTRIWEAPGMTGEKAYLPHLMVDILLAVILGQALGMTKAR